MSGREDYQECVLSEAVVVNATGYTTTDDLVICTARGQAAYLNLRKLRQ